MEPTNDTLKEMMSASSCIHKGEYPEAIQILQKLIDSGNQEGFIFLALGDTYCNLTDEYSRAKAKDCLGKAIEAATASKDLQVVVAAKASLGRIYIQEAHNEFDNLHEEDKWVELCQRILDCNQEKPALLFFLSNPCECTTPVSGLRGRYSGIAQPPQCKSGFCS
jgi:tetratricopeptide (TPR) repeat protein